ncbi:IS3 family transposase [Thomasclavelia cocleata]
MRRAKLIIRIKEIHRESKEIYGAPKITRILQKEGHGKM